MATAYADPAAPPLRRWGIVPLISYSFGLLMMLFVLTDLFFRPAFVANAFGSEAREHVTPAIVSMLHLAIQLAIAGTFMLLPFFSRTHLRRSLGFLTLVGAFSMIAALSLISATSMRDVIYVPLLVISCLGYAIFVSSDHARAGGMEQALASFALGMAISLGLALIVGEYSWGRLASRAGPNFWGTIAFLCCVSAFALRSWWLRVPPVLLSTAVLMLASARGSMLAAMVGLLVLFMTRYRFRNRGQVWLLLFGLLAVAFLLVAGGSFLGSEVLHLDDKERGLSSGGTGRSLAWAQAWTAFVDHPFLGVGYRLHPSYVTAATSAHNAYLGTLADVGVFGFLVYLVIFVGGGIRGIMRVRRTKSEADSVAVALLCGFLALGLFESFGFSTSLPVTLMMILPCAWLWSTPPRTGLARLKARAARSGTPG